jgi:hypothetical protein
MNLSAIDDWATKFLFNNPNNKGDFKRFLRQVDQEGFDRSDGDDEATCRASFEQISEERIFDELNKNIALLKSFETIINERMQAYVAFLGCQTKIKPAFDMFQYCRGTLRQALDALFVYIEQVVYLSCQLWDETISR